MAKINDINMNAHVESESEPEPGLEVMESESKDNMDSESGSALATPGSISNVSWAPTPILTPTRTRTRTRAILGPSRVTRAAAGGGLGSSTEVVHIDLASRHLESSTKHKYRHPTEVSEVSEASVASVSCRPKTRKGPVLLRAQHVQSQDGLLSVHVPSSYSSF